MAFDYFWGEQSEQFVFYRTPKVLYTDPKFEGLSPLAKQLYGILLDRVSLSVKNHWQEADGRVYIYCTLKSIMKALSCSDKTATRLMVELEKIGLIERKRQGLGKPNKIYVKNFIESDTERFRNRKNYDSGIVDSTTPEPEKVRAINTEDSETDFMDTYPISPKEDDEREKYRRYFMDALSIDILKQRDPLHEGEIDELLELILDTVCTTKKTVLIAGEERPAQVVRSRFMKLDSGHLEYVLACMKENTTQVRNMKQYLLAALYNAPLTINSYYQSLVNHDMAEGKI